VFKKSSIEWIHSLEIREPAGKLKAGNDPKPLKSALKSIECVLLILQCSDVKKRYYLGKKKSFLGANRLGSVFVPAVRSRRQPINIPKYLSISR